MYTYVHQCVVSFQSAEEDSNRLDAYQAELEELAKKHGIEILGSESIRLADDDFHIAHCQRCGDLTVERTDVVGDLKNVVSDFWRYVRRGTVTGNTALCDFCGNRMAAS